MNDCECRGCAQIERSAEREMARLEKTADVLRDERDAEKAAHARTQTQLDNFMGTLAEETLKLVQAEAERDTALARIAKLELALRQLSVRTFTDECHRLIRAALADDAKAGG